MGFTFPMANGLTFLIQLMKSESIYNCQDFQRISSLKKRGIFLSTQRLCECHESESATHVARPQTLIFIKNKGDFKPLPWMICIQYQIEVPIPSLNCIVVKASDYLNSNFKSLESLEQSVSQSGAVLILGKDTPLENSILFNSSIENIFNYISNKFFHFYLYIPQELEIIWKLEDSLSRFEFYGNTIAPIQKGQKWESYFINTYACYRSEMNPKQPRPIY